ncbi:tetratricopeptide repeat protein [Frankia gtarii]|uniref:tetratricopeptide repeat protein n=1 Tax=Frankia gtarii TaxID=2950102 RepID=UPI0021C13323|nr:toll/interleukin-1 receptor domain-containing protein [Frankia gtarii]
MRSTRPLAVDAAVTAQPDTHLFLSYAGPDENWVTWISDILEFAGRTVRVQPSESPGGQYVVSDIGAEVARAERVLVVCSPTLFDAPWCTLEWVAALATRPLLLVRVADGPVPEVLATVHRVHRVDLFGVDAAAAARRLLDAVAAPDGPRPAGPDPDAPVAPFPALLPAGWNVPGRDRLVVERATLLGEVRQALTGGPVPAVVLRGPAGCGRTQLAVEYAHRHAPEYSLVRWMDAGQLPLLGQQIAALAGLLALPTDAGVDETVGAVLAELNRRERWLLVFDDARDAPGLWRWLDQSLPARSGHLLLVDADTDTDTDVDADADGRARRAGPVPTVEVGPLPRERSVALLTARRPDLDPGVTDAVAARLADQPLAVGLAARLLAQDDRDPRDFLADRQGHSSNGHSSNGSNADGSNADGNVSQGRSLHSSPVELCWSLFQQRCALSAPTTVRLLELCALLAPAPVPLSLLRAASPPPRRGWIGHHHRQRRGDDGERDLHRTVAIAVDHGLARRAGDSIVLHPLVRDAIAAGLTPRGRRELGDLAGRLLAAAYSQSPTDRPVWSAQAPVVPHLLAALDTLDDPDDPHQLHAWADVHSSHLYARGAYAAAEYLARDLYRRNLGRFGPDHRDTLATANNLAVTLLAVGQRRAAREVEYDTLARRRHFLGENHPDTLATAVNLAIVLWELGEHEAARGLHADTVARSRAALGEDHPDTLARAHQLAGRLGASGDLANARALTEDVLARRRRLLGDDHPETLDTTADLADLLRGLGRFRAARALDEDLLDRLRRLLGDDHPDVLAFASRLANTLDDLGEFQSARRLAEEVLARRRRLLGDDHPDTLASTHSLAASLSASGDYRGAQELFEEALSRWRRQFAAARPRTDRPVRRPRQRPDGGMAS